MYKLLKEFVEQSENYKDFEVVRSYPKDLTKLRKNTLIIEEINTIPSDFSDNVIDEVVQTQYIVILSKNRVNYEMEKELVKWCLKNSSKISFNSAMGHSVISGFYYRQIVFSYNIEY